MQEPQVPAGRDAGPGPLPKTGSMVPCALAQRRGRPHLPFSASTAMQPQADGAGSALPVTAAGAAHRGMAQSTEGSFCSVSKGQPPAERRGELQGSSSSMSLTLLPHCEALAGFPPLHSPCRVRMWQRCRHPPALAPSPCSLCRSVPSGPARCFLPGWMSGQRHPVLPLAWEKRPVTGKEQVREMRVLPYCTINHEKFFLLSCMKQNLAGHSDHRDSLLALQ